jgi:hypothetical protein
MNAKQICFTFSIFDLTNRHRPVVVLEFTKRRACCDFYRGFRLGLLQTFENPETGSQYFIRGIRFAETYVFFARRWDLSEEPMLTLS